MRWPILERMTALGSRPSHLSDSPASPRGAYRPPVGSRRVIPSRRVRAIAALAIGVVCGLVSFAATRLPGFRNQDFHSWWLAARAILDGADPYTTIRAGASHGFVYPLPAALLTIPLAWLPSTVAGPLFVFMSCSLLAYVVTRTEWWPLCMFLSGSMFLTVVAGQWSALLTAALYVPALSWLAVVKPNIGLAMIAYAPRKRTVVAIILLAGASLLVMPSWPREWIAVVSESSVHFAPYAVAGGFLTLAVLLRWRRPEARLLAVLAVVPSSPIAYETLPLFIIPRGRVEMLILALLSDVLCLLMYNISMESETAQYLRIARPAIVWLMYMPCAAFILMRRNVGHANVDESDGGL
jgi:hypothetical protein